jgi:vacuolar protein sorting-associated protein 26
MDGSPSRGETIPIRLFLGGFDLTPTFREVNKKYSTRYYLSLVLIDEGKLTLTASIEDVVDMNCRCTEVF